jgi:hypothetical protein
VRGRRLNKSVAEENKKTTTEKKKEKGCAERGHILYYRGKRSVTVRIAAVV